MADYEDSCEEEPTLSGFLEEVALVADIDSLDEDAGLCGVDDAAQCKRSGISSCISGRNGRRAVSELYDHYRRQMRKNWKKNDGCVTWGSPVPMKESDADLRPAAG